MTAADAPASGEEDDRYAVSLSIGGLVREFPVGSQLAAACAVDYSLREHPDTAASWKLRDDMDHPRPLLMLTRHTGSTDLHATELVPGKLANEHPRTLCGERLDWAGNRVRVASEFESGPRCPGCLAGLQELMSWV